MDHLPYLHAAHQVREAFDGLRIVSFAVVGLAIGALFVTWGKLLAWLRSPDERTARLRRWGEDDQGLFFEFFQASAAEWRAELSDGTFVPLAPRPDGLLGGTGSGARPVAIVDAEGLRLPL